MARQQSTHPIKLITKPTVILIAKMELDINGLNDMVDWVADYRPECLPDDLDDKSRYQRAMSLFPHGGLEEGANGTRQLTSNEMLVELSGRECYHSYGLKAGRKSNLEYVDRLIRPEPGAIPHASVAYHAKLSFFVAGISRRVSHELIRHYVGADRTEEGSPSQESTRYTEHPGHIAIPPHITDHEPGSRVFDEYVESQQAAYDGYRSFIENECAAFREAHGHEPKNMERKRIYEAAAGLLPMQACTSLIWTTNPMALNKLLKERVNEAADREFFRFATLWQEVAAVAAPNLITKSA